MSNYDISRIKPQQIDAAYVLAQAAVPSLSLSDWRRFCQGVTGNRQVGDDDVFVATNALGHIHGLSVAALRRHLTYNFTLDVSLFAVASAADEAGVANDLIEYLLAHARAMRCGAVRFWGEGSAQWQHYTTPRWVSQGPEGATFLLQSSEVSR